MSADDDDELFEGTTPSPFTPSLFTPSPSTATSRQLRPKQQAISDFGRRGQQRHETTLEMTRPPRLMDTIIQRIPVIQRTPISEAVTPTQDVASTTKAPQTTVPSTTGTTAAPDPDAVVCSGRPFDSFMQLKNGSIYAFRGE